MATIDDLRRWHDDDDHERIVLAIEAMPDRDANLVGLYARALNNLGRYADALRALEPLAAQSVDDALWQFRMGYALLGLGRPAEAVRHFERAIALGDDDEDTRELLRMAKARLPGEGNPSANGRNRR